MKLFEGLLLFAGPIGFRLQPRRQSIRKGIQLARSIGDLELRLDAVGSKVFADGVPGQAGPAADLPDR